MIDLPERVIGKVAFVASVYHHLEIFHLPFMQLLQNKGYEVHAYAGYDGGKEGVLNKGMVCHDINFQRSPLRNENIKVLKSLISSFRKEKFLMVHVHTPVAGILGRIAAKITGIPVVIYTAHGFHFFRGAPLPYWLLFYPVERMMARWTDFLITINTEDSLRAKDFKVRKKEIYVPGVGVDLEKHLLMDEEKVRHTVRKELGFKDEDFLILCVAELNPNKNQIQLIQAINQLREYKGIHCLLAGTGDSEVQLRKAIKELHLIPYVHFLGFRLDIAQLMAASDVITLLSKREGLPRVLMEGMAAGKPIIATNIRGNNDIVANGETGYLVPVSDVGATVDAFVKIYKDPQLRLKMGQRNRELVQRFDIKAICKIMEQIYDKALNHSGC